MKKAEFHIIPTNDLDHHIIDVSCKCKPTIKDDEHSFCVHHHSFDGREGLELAYKQLGTEIPDSDSKWELVQVGTPSENPSKCILIVADYEEFKPETYKGIYLFDSGKELYRSSTGNFERDYSNILEKGARMAYKLGKLLVDSSSIDHWFMDRNK